MPNIAPLQIVSVSATCKEAMTIEAANDHVFKESWNEVPIVERALPYLGQAILDVEGTAGYRGQVHGRYSACLGGAAGLVSKTVQRNGIKN